jgi:hypothetical protein
MAEKKTKALAEFKKSHPEQLSLFELLTPQGNKYSNTIELYDFMPKYHWGKVQRINGKFLESLEREFECRGETYKIKIHPARIKGKDGKEKEYYPSKREELVEDALRKFVCEGQGVFLDNQVGVTFTLYQLQKELRERGHSYSLDQLKEAIFVCAQTKLIVSSEKHGLVLVSSIFETVGLQTREEWMEQETKVQAFVRFNPLITKSIKSSNFRLLNYAKSMSYKSVISRQLHKRMSHHYTQASIATTYHILLSTMIRDFGLTSYSQLRDNLRDVEIALDELKDKDVVLNYKIEKIKDEKKHNKLLDAKIIITPTPQFGHEVMLANKRQNEIQKLADKTTI